MPDNARETKRLSAGSSVYSSSGTSTTMTTTTTWMWSLVNQAAAALIYKQRTRDSLPLYSAGCVQSALYAYTKVSCQFAHPCDETCKEQQVPWGFNNPPRSRRPEHTHPLEHVFLQLCAATEANYLSLCHFIIPDFNCLISRCSLISNGSPSTSLVSFSSFSDNCLRELW